MSPCPSDRWLSGDLLRWRRLSATRDLSAASSRLRRPCASRRERRLDEQPAADGRGAAADPSAGLALRGRAITRTGRPPADLAQVRPDEVPRAHVLRLFLHPDDLVGRRVDVERRAQTRARDRIELLEPADRDVARRGRGARSTERDRRRPCRCRGSRGGSPPAGVAPPRRRSAMRKRPSASSRGADATSGWRSRLFGVSTTSGSGSVSSSAAWRRSRWKYCAAVVQLAIRMLMSAASCRKRSGRALA